MKQRDPAHPIANKLARALPSEAAIVAANEKGIRVAQLGILRAGRAVEAAKVHKQVAALALRLPPGHQDILRRVCNAGGGVLAVRVTDEQTNTVCALLMARKLIQCELGRDGYMIEYRATAAGREMVGLNHEDTKGDRHG